MKRISYYFLCGLLLSSTLFLSACNKEKEPDASEVTSSSAVSTEEAGTEEILTADELIDRMQEALKENPCSEAALSTKLNMTLAPEEGEATEMSLKSDVTIRLSQDPVGCFTKVYSSSGYGGEVMSASAESYTVTEDGKLASYVYSDGFWFMEETDQTAEELKHSASAIAVDKSTASIDESVTEWNGPEELESYLNQAACSWLMGV